MPNYQRRIVYLSEAQREELFSNGSITVNGATITYDANDMYVTPQEEPYVKPVGGIPGSDLASDVIPQEVIVSSTQPTDEGNKIWIGEDSGTEYSVPTMDDLYNYVQKTDYATSSAAGVVKTGEVVYLDNENKLRLSGATATQIKNGANANYPITPYMQHESVFYGLAKIAGDLTQSESSNSAGTYTPAAKTAIQTMLGVESGVSFVETVSGTTPSITGEPNTRYMCGEVTSIAITSPSSGTIDVIFTSGSTPAVLTVTPPTGTTMKWPAWFNSASLATNTTYEINIMDGVYGAVMTW